MVENLRSATCRTRNLLGALAVSAALALGIQAMAPASADAMRRTTAECDGLVGTAVQWFTRGDYVAYSWYMNEAEICYAE
jgi:hypothetical protein